MGGNIDDKFIERFNDWDIYFNVNGGWFHTTIAQKLFKDRTLEGLKRKLMKTKRAVKIMSIGHNWHTFEVDVYTAIPDGVRWRDGATGKLLPDLIYYQYDEDVERKVKDIQGRNSLLVGEYNMTVDGLKRIFPHLVEKLYKDEDA